jgi:hypothetical protein
MHQPILITGKYNGLVNLFIFYHFPYNLGIGMIQGTFAVANTRLLHGVCVFMEMENCSFIYNSNCRPTVY